MSEEVKEEVVTEEVTEVVNEMESSVIDPSLPVMTVKKLLEAGAHFGHQTRRWNPAMKPYIYTARNGIYIIDLNKTCKAVEVAYAAMKEIVAKDGKVLFVGTKKNAQEIVQEEAARCGSFYATNRWLGGTLTNFRTISKRMRYLRDIENMEKDGTFDVLPKKEVANYYKEKEKLEKSLGGIKEMRKIPQALFVIDPHVEINAVREARRLGIPVFGIVDTNSDPDLCDYVIPANDDSTKSVKLLVQVMADAIVEAKGGDMTSIMVAYHKDEGEEATMDDVIANADKVEEAKQAARAAQAAAKKEAMEKARKTFKKGPRKEYVKTTAEVKDAPAAEEALATEAPAEAAPAEEKPKRTRKTTKKVEAPVEEAAKEEAPATEAAE